MESEKRGRPSNQRHNHSFSGSDFFIGEELQRLALIALAIVPGLAVLGVLVLNQPPIEITHPRCGGAILSSFAGGAKRFG